MELHVAKHRAVLDLPHQKTITKPNQREKPRAGDDDLDPNGRITRTAYCPAASEESTGRQQVSNPPPLCKKLSHLAEAASGVVAQEPEMRHPRIHADKQARRGRYTDSAHQSDEIDFTAHASFSERSGSPAPFQ